MAKKENAKTPVPSEYEFKKKLSAEQYHVLREKGTETPFTGKLLNEDRNGMYKCAACGFELFDSSSKYASDCGWPSFDAPKDKSAVKTQLDLSHGMIRDEVLCPNCGSHLGHVFNDSSTKTGKWFCINSLSLAFEIGKDGKLVKKKK